MKLKSAWAKLQNDSPATTFVEHFASLAPTPGCRALLQKLSTKVTGFSTAVDDGELELVVQFGAAAHWRCFAPANGEAVRGLPETYARLLRVHNGLVHHFEAYSWDDIWLDGAESGDGDDLASLTPINNRDAYFYVFLPSKRTAAREPSLGVKAHEGTKRSARQLVLSEPYGVPGLFLRLACRELLGSDEPLIGGYIGPD